MLRVVAFFVFLGLILQPAIAQISSTGAPASALSPTLNSGNNSIPASATSPQGFPFIVEPFPSVSFPVIVQPFPSVRRFHTFPVVHPVNTRLRPFGIHHRQFIPQIPIFYPVYGPAYDYSAYPPIADPTVSQDAQPTSADSDAAVARSEDALRQAYLQGARDALVEEQRGRQDARDALASRSAEPARPKKVADDAAQPPKPDNSPATVFIFKDGRQLETKNYAIMGQTLYDISGTVVKKVPLADLDTAATVKANDDRGIIVKLP